MKLGELVISANVLMGLGNQKLPAKAAFQLRRVIEQVQVELARFDKVREELAKQYGDDIGDGKYKIREESLEKFAAEMNDLLGADIDIAIQKIGIDAFQGVELSVQDLVLLDWLISE